MREPRLSSRPSFFHPNTNRRIYRFASSGEIGETLRDAATAVLGLGRALLPTFIVGVFDGTFQPHLDQMQHTPVHDAPRERAHQLGVWNAAEVVREVGVYDFPMVIEQRLLHLGHRLL